MQSESDKPSAQPQTARPNSTTFALDYTRPLRPIADLLTEPGFPKCAVGEFVDIGGYTGIVTEIVNQSLKVRSPEGATKSFNANGLRRIYGPRLEPPPMVAPPPPERADEPPESPRLPDRPEPPLIQPDFSKPVRDIRALVANRGFPESALGEHVEIAGYSGVIVQVVNRSLKVRSQGETTRSYNSDALRKLYGK